MTNDELVPGFDALSEEPWQFRLQNWDGTPGGLLVHTFGPLHSYNEDVFFRKMELLVSRGYRRLVFDLAGSIWPDEGLFGRLRTLQTSLNKKGGAFVLVRVHPQVELAFDLRGEDRSLLNIRRTLEEAADYFMVREGKYTRPVFPVLSECPFCGRSFRATRPGAYQCSPDQCGWSLKIDENGRESPYHGLLVPGFDDEPLDGLEVSVTRLPAVAQGLLIRHRGTVDHRNLKAYRGRITKLLAAGFTRLAFDCSSLEGTKYPFVHKALFEKNLPAALGFVLSGVPATWAPYWKKGLCPPPACAQADNLAEAAQVLATPELL
jgi:anti-anti-sigma regulatory factor